MHRRAQRKGLGNEFSFAFRERTTGPGSWSRVLREVGYIGVYCAYREAIEIKRNNRPMRSAEEWFAAHENEWYMGHPAAHRPKQIRYSQGK